MGDDGARARGASGMREAAGATSTAPGSPRPAPSHRLEDGARRLADRAALKECLPGSKRAKRITSRVSTGWSRKQVGNRMIYLHCAVLLLTHGRGTNRFFFFCSSHWPKRSPEPVTGDSPFGEPSMRHPCIASKIDCLTSFEYRRVGAFGGAGSDLRRGFLGAAPGPSVFL